MPPPTDTDTDGALFEQLRARLHAISWRIVGSKAEAEDVVQDCFLKWQVADQDALTTPAAWLTTVVQHQSIDHLRRRAREAQAARTAMELTPQPEPASPEDALLGRAALADALARLLAALSPAERLALVLHEVFECEHTDVARALGTSNANSRQQLARARKRLRALETELPASEKLCQELLRRFQAAINGLDMPAMISLLGEPQPVSVLESPLPRMRHGTCANDALYRITIAA